MLLVTGRRLDDLFRTFDATEMFDLVVVENGALLYDPSKKSEEMLTERPPDEFFRALAGRGVSPLDRGHSIIATLENQKQTVIETIAEFGLELQIIFNKGSLMILPAGVTKATGLEAALPRLGLSHHNVVAIGDAENDHAFLGACEFGVAVANALPALKDRSDIVTKGDHGDGVIELIGEILRDDLQSFSGQLERHRVLLGSAGDQSVAIPVFGTNLLLAGPSGAGKSTLNTGIMERLVAAGYQLIALDPEGDYQQFPKSVILGDAHHEPPIDQVLQALASPGQSVIANLLGVPLESRPDYFDRILPGLADLQSKFGRPHAIVCDEVHHLAPADRSSVPLPAISGLIAATLDPACIAVPVLKLMNAVIVVGDDPGRPLNAFGTSTGLQVPTLEDTQEKGQAILWRLGNEPIRFQVAECETPRTRHSRKYAEAVLTPDRSFYFRGPGQKLNLRASNLITFVQMMEGVDDETFSYHLRNREFSAWFRENIKNAELADETERIERSSSPAKESRAAIKSLIEDRYTLPG